MKKHIENLLFHALKQLQTEDVITQTLPNSLVIEHTKNKQFGDFASNAAMIMAKKSGTPPRDLAAKIIGALPVSDKITRVEIAGPGFINFYLTETAQHSIISDILSQGDDFGKSKPKPGIKVHIEFVSANPTGPLHVGHGRSAAFGAACANIMAADGIEVHKEYYVNDAGRQMNILATSIWLRYLELCGENFFFPSNGYKGEYVKDIAAKLFEKYQRKFHASADDVFNDIPPDEGHDGSGDKEAHIDALIERAKSLSGSENYQLIFDEGLNDILADIKADLAEFGVTYDEWFSERSLYHDEFIYKTINKLTEKGHTYEQDGNIWFKATAFGDDKDRVLIRRNGVATYFASDISYHLNKFQRGATNVIDVLGADHHGYIPRICAAMEALGLDKNNLTFPTVQFAILYRGQEKVQMSTRSGEFVTLRELREEVGNDAARFFYVMRKNEQHLDFDLDLAKSHSNDNPVYYIQYAHARIASVARQLTEKNLPPFDKTNGLKHIALLTEPGEKNLIETLNKYQETLHQAATHYEPHVLCHYLRNLANDFHSYYNAHQFIVPDENLRNARLALIFATQQVLKNGLSLLGVSAPEMM